MDPQSALLPVSRPPEMRSKPNFKEKLVLARTLVLLMVVELHHTLPKIGSPLGAPIVNRIIPQLLTHIFQMTPSLEMFPGSRFAPRKILSHLHLFLHHPV